MLFNFLFDGTRAFRESAPAHHIEQKDVIANGDACATMANR